MSFKKFNARWFLNDSTKNSLRIIEEILKNGGTITEKCSPFEPLENGYIDLRGIDLTKRDIKGVKFQNIDFSFSDFTYSWIESNSFENVIFEKCDFSEITEKSNKFLNVNFKSCKINKAGFGYLSSQYESCLFENTSFTRTGFIRPEFNNTKFIDCNLKGVDFNASSFENCSFAGLVKDVWFRGGYGFSGEKNFGKARPNEMKNVSFADASLIDVSFSNDCKLSNIILPQKGFYVYFDHWKKRLEHLQSSITDWSSLEKKEAEIFIYAYMVHAINQDEMILNIDEMYKEYGSDFSDNILILLKEKAF